MELPRRSVSDTSLGRPYVWERPARIAEEDDGDDDDDDNYSQSYSVEEIYSVRDSPLLGPPLCSLHVKRIFYSHGNGRRTRLNANKRD